MSKVSEAAKWALDKGDGKNCPFCAWQANASSDRRALSMHMRGSHKTRLVAAHEQNTLEPEVRNDPIVSETTADVLEAVGITQVDELDRFNYLAIPEHLKAQAKAEGAYLRWVAPRNVGHNKNLGASEVRISEMEAEGVKQASTETGVVTTGEMRLMRFPERLAKQRRELKASRVDTQLRARGEEMQKSQSDAEKILYDHYVKEVGLDHTRAMQVARAQAGRAQRESARADGRDPRQGLTIRDQRGERAY